jgi:ankyrin repeat protein
LTSDWTDAARLGDVDRLRCLLASGADVNARDEHGQTALMIAAGNGRSSAIRLLVENGAVLDCTAKYGLSAVMLAVIGGHLDAVRTLAEAGANLAIRGTGAPGFSGKTAVELAAALDRIDIVEVLRNAEGGWSGSS